MKRSNSRRFAGFGLVEVLVTVVVLSFGFLGLSKLHGYMLSIGASAKMRVEATQLAEEKMNELRGYAEGGQFAALAGGEDAPKSKLGTMEREWQVADKDVVGTDVHSKTLQVTVAWSGPDGTEQRVQLANTVAWVDPIKTAMVVTGENLNLPAGLPPTPRGQAEPGDGKEKVDMTGEETPNTVEGHDDGTRIHEDERGVIRLVASDGTVLLRLIGCNAKEDDDGKCAFSTISGRIYLDDSVVKSIKGDLLAHIAKHFDVRMSDASYCSRVLPDPLPTDSEVAYFIYQCYVGPAWYGKISLLRSDKVSLNDRVCVGDAIVSASEVSDSSHPQLSFTRNYRGFQTLDGGTYKTTGMGFVGSGDYVPMSYVRDDFLLAIINGKPDDTACLNEMQTSESAFEGNSGKFVCLSGADTCPHPLPGTVGADIDVLMIVEGALGGRMVTGASAISIEFAAGSSTQACAVSTKTAGSKTSYSYRCEYVGDGLTGTGPWSVSMTVASASGSSGTVSTTVGKTPNKFDDTKIDVTGANGALPGTVVFNDMTAADLNGTFVIDMSID